MARFFKYAYPFTFIARILQGGNPRSRIHHEVLENLVCFVRSLWGEDVNFDHLDLPVPKAPIPLKYKGRKYDLAFIYDEHIVFIEVKTVKASEVVKEEEERYGEV